MPYVPPHLRSSQSTHSSSSATTGNNTTTETLETDQQKLNSQWNQNNSSSSSSSSVSFNAARRSSSSNLPSSRTTLSVPEPVFQQWKPSERVFRLKPEQIEEVRLRLNVDVTVSPDSPPAPAPIESFTDMCLDTSIMKDITFHEYTRPTSIQAQAMPVALNGRDLLGCAETGSGKTAAFAIPMIQHCLAQPPIRRGDGPLALVLAPTRELAQQIEKEVKAFSKSLESFRTAIVVGGTNMAEQRSELRAGVNIVVATPGRFIDHLQQGNTSLSRISFVVLDEADRMLDMGFEPQIREVMHNLPKKHQTLLFSATMPLEIEALAQEYLTNPVQVKVGKVSSPTANVSQNLEKVAENEKIDRLLALLVEEAAQSDRSGHPLPLTIVFVERKTRCDEVEEALVAQGLHAVALHGGRSQSEREAALRDFRNGSTNILVATDVASRGLDVTGVAHVINLDLPKTMEDYVHRIGRTGRAGSTGQATSFYTDRDMFLVAHIRKAINDAESGNSIAFATGKIMSIISQNVVRTNKKIKVTGEETDEPLVQEGSEETEVANDSSLDGSKSRKRKKEASEKEKKSNIKQGKEMKRLENFLFGSLYSPVVFGKEEEEETNDALMITDRSGVRDLEGIEDDVEFREESGDEIEIKDRKPAWVDDEEDKTNIDIAKLNRLRKLRKDEKETSILGSDYVERLRAHHVKLNPGTEWAHAGPRSGDGSDSEKEAGEDVKDTDDILRTNEDIVVKGGVKLLPGHLEFSKLADANVEDPSNGPINSVQFHRNAQLLLTAGLDRRLRFFQIDGKRNTMIQSIFLEDCPIRKAAFLPDGSQVIAAGRRKFFYSFDLVKAKVDKIGPLSGRDEKSLEVFGVSPDSSTIAFVGNEGYILLVSTRTKELIGTMKMNGTARSLAFADDGRQLLSSGGDGHVYHWDLRTRTCFHKAVDEGCINGSSLSTSPNGSLFAAGSGSGIVNIYNRAEFLGGKRKPIKTVENITTKVDFAKFNHDSQILAICSSMQKNSLKLVHIPSFSVFSNWPPANQILHFPRCLDFSPGGGFMAVGNAVGKVLLYKLHHYPHA